MPGIDSYTKLLLHCDGADASTTFIDSATGKAISVVAHAQVDTAQSKFGGASLLLDSGTDDGLTTPDHEDWNFGSGNFTIDFWIRIAGDPGATRNILSQETAGYLRIAMLSGRKMYWDCYAGAGGAWNNEATTLIATDTWTHCAFVRYGNVQTMYIGGVAQASPGSFNGSLDNLTGLLKIGTGLTVGLPCWLDEIRISKGIARWTANFTPPTAPYSVVSKAAIGIGNPYIF